MPSGGSRILHPVTRRRFLTGASVGLAAAGAVPGLSSPFVSRALAADKELTIVQWSHFVPAFDKWFDQFAADWGKKNGDRRHCRPHPGTEHRRARGRRGIGRVRGTICSCGTAPAAPISTASFWST